MLKLLRIEKRHNIEGTINRFLFEDEHGKNFMAEVKEDAPKEIQKHWYNLTLGFSTAIRSNQDLWVTGCKLKPGTCMVDPESYFKMEVVERDIAFIPKPTKEEKKRKDWE